VNRRPIGFVVSPRLVSQPKAIPPMAAMPWPGTAEAPAQRSSGAASAWRAAAASVNPTIPRLGSEACTAGSSSDSPAEIQVLRASDSSVKRGPSRPSRARARTAR